MTKRSSAKVRDAKSSGAVSPTKSPHMEDGSDKNSGAKGSPVTDGVSQGATSNPMPDIDPDILAAIRLCIQEEYASVRADIKLLSDRLGKFDKLSQDITTFKATVTSVESGLQFATNRLDHMEKKVIPAVTRHVSTLSQRLLHETMKMDAHRRKWNVVIHGIDGVAGEDESVTRQAVKDFAKSALKLSPDDIRDSTFSACHRLSKKMNAGIIVRFVDLTYRDKWLAGARNIQSYLSELIPPSPDKKISLAIDLPPKIRPLKDNLMKKRRELPLEKRRKSKLRYLAQWPFVELRVEGEATISPTETLSDLAKSTLGIDLLAQLPRFENG